MSTSPEKLSTALQLLSNLAKLYLKVSPHFGEAVSAPLAPTVEAIASLSAFLSGSPLPFAQVVQAYLKFTSQLAPLLAKCASDLDHILNLPSKGPLPSDFTTHPNGYVYSPSVDERKLVAIKSLWVSLKTQPKYLEASTALFASLESWRSSLEGNSRVSRAVRSAQRVWDGNADFHTRLSSLLEGLSAAGTVELDTVKRYVTLSL